MNYFPYKETHFFDFIQFPSFVAQLCNLVAHPVGQARTWLQIQRDLGLAQNTVEAYGRALEGFLAFSVRDGFSPESATREHIARYVRDLSSCPNPRGDKIRVLDTGCGLANATLQQRLTAVRLF